MTNQPRYLYIFVIHCNTMRRDKLLTVRIEPELEKKINSLEREKLETRSNIVREALIAYIQKETESKEIKKIIAEKFARGSISFEEVVRLVGYEDARKIAFFVETTKKSFEEGLQ